MSRTIGSTSGVRCTSSGVTSASPRARGDKALSKPDVPVPNTNPAVADDFKNSRRLDMVPLLRAKGSDGASIIHAARCARIRRAGSVSGDLAKSIARGLRSNDRDVLILLRVCLGKVAA